MRIFLIALAALLPLTAWAQIPQPVRDTPYDWRCVGPDGTVSEHQRQDTALYACQRAAADNPGEAYFVEPGRYRVSMDAAEREPEPEPSEPNALFSDSFESGDLLANGQWSWGSSVRTEVTDENPKTGDYSLRFRFPGGDGDAFAEQRFDIGQPLTELWLSWSLYVPENYYHRADSPSNNKLLFLWSREYGSSAHWGNTLSFEMWADEGKSRLTYNPADLSGHKGHRPVVLDPEVDAGKWVDFVLHFRIQSGSGTEDGVLELWKTTEGRETEKLFDLHDLNSTWGPDWNDNTDYNFIDQGYFLGWSNSGFDADTVFYLDDVELDGAVLH